MSLQRHDAPPPWVRTQRPRDRLPDHPDVATRAASAAPGTGWQHDPLSNLRRPPVRTPSTLSVGYAGDLTGFPAGLPDVQRRTRRPPSFLEQECPTSPALREARVPTLPPGLATANPTVTGAASTSDTDTRRRFHIDVDSTRFGRASQSPPKRASTRPPPDRRSWEECRTSR
jgi:hypothetical protein